MRFRTLSLAMALLAAPLAARAQPFFGLYVGAGAGYNLPEDVDVRGPVSASLGRQLNLKGSFAGLGSIGYAIGNGMRFEVEGSYRRANVSSVSASAFPLGALGSRSASGSLRTYAAMANMLFDMDIGVPWLFPYIGGGAGYAWTNVNGLSIGSLTLPPGPCASLGALCLPASAGANVSSTHGGFAYQAIAGLSFPIPNVPGLSVTSEYRFFSVLGTGTFTGTSTLGTPVSFKLGTQHTHSFLLGVRYAFNVARPVPVAPAAQEAPAPAPTRSYVVFFDWDKATLTDRARQIIKEAADNSTRVQYTRIEVNGYTDTSGTHRYNQDLSVRRAKAVQAELVKDGVPANAITIQGFGDTHLLVPTGPGVREPQNRRVEIVIR